MAPNDYDANENIWKSNTRGHETDNTEISNPIDDEECEDDKSSVPFLSAENLAEELAELSIISNGAIDGLTKMEKLGVLMFGEMEEVEESVPDDNSGERLFMKLWRPISNWATPMSSELLEQFQSNKNEQSYNAGLTSVYDKSDIGISRCNGLMAILKINASFALKALEINECHQKNAIERLGALIRTFDFVHPMIKLSADDWRLLTIVLLSMTQHNDGELMIPSVVEDSNLSTEEYKYLARSSIIILSKGS